MFWQVLVFQEIVSTFIPAIKGGLVGGVLKIIAKNHSCDDRLKERQVERQNPWDKKHKKERWKEKKQRGKKQENSWVNW